MPSQEYPRMMYRGEADLEAADNVGAEEHLIVNDDEEKEAALKEGYRLSLDESKDESEDKPKAEKKSAKPKGDKKPAE
jgi:hypothetical protein